MANSKIPQQFATWWSSRVIITEGQLLPQGPYIRYDPFSFYYPRRESNRFKRSLPYEFLHVDAADENQVAAFCERFGMLGVELQRFEEWPTTTGRNHELINMLTQTAKKQDDSIKSIRLEESTQVHPLATAPSSIAAFAESQGIMKEVVRRAKPDAGSRPIDRRFLEYIFGRKTGMARPRLLWDIAGAQWSTGWHIDSLETALYLMLLFDLQGGGRILACRRCHEIFLGDHPRTEYCSARCQNHDKVDRWRRLVSYANHAQLTKRQAEKALMEIGIDYSKHFDFGKADHLRLARNKGGKHGSKRR